jgi:hypothetical protein
MGPVPQIIQDGGHGRHDWDTQSMILLEEFSQHGCARSASDASHTLGRAWAGIVVF